MADSNGDDRPDHPTQPTAAQFDEAFSAMATSAGLPAVFRDADPDLPAEVEPYSFVSAALLDGVARALALSPGQRLVDLACGRGGPGLWLARQAGATLIGVDFSPVAVAQATARAALFGLADRARFVVGELTDTGLADAGTDAAVSIDAFHFAADLDRAAGEAARLLHPGGRLVLTNWQPRSPGDERLPSHRRDTDWARTLTAAGFADVQVVPRSDWHDHYTRIYRLALGRPDPGDDPALAALQEEARRQLPQADLQDRVLVTATRPPR